jgi:hypothetical protein
MRASRRDKRIDPIPPCQDANTAQYRSVPPNTAQYRLLPPITAFKKIKNRTARPKPAYSCFWADALPDESTQVVDFHDNNGDAYRSLITVLGLRTIIRF